MPSQGAQNAATRKGGNRAGRGAEHERGRGGAKSLGTPHASANRRNTVERAGKWGMYAGHAIGGVIGVGLMGIAGLKTGWGWGGKAGQNLGLRAGVASAHSPSALGYDGGGGSGRTRVDEGRGWGGHKTRGGVGETLGTPSAMGKQLATNLGGTNAQVIPPIPTFLRRRSIGGLGLG